MIEESSPDIGEPLGIGELMFVKDCRSVVPTWIDLGTCRLRRGMLNVENESVAEFFII